jgi:hypothetical protein
MATVTVPEPVRNWPLWWFARLEAAVQRGDYRTAARAQRQLERLGVTVQYRVQRRMGPRGGSHKR